MAIKAIAMDLDGTLLNDQKEISPRTRDALIEAQKNGVVVILASGRVQRGIEKYAEELELEKYEGYLVSSNGAVAYDCKTKEVIFNQTMSVENGKAILEHVKNFDVIPMLYRDEYIYVNDVFKNIVHLPDGDFNIVEYEARNVNCLLCEKEDLAAFADFPMNKILLAADPEYLEAHYKEIRKPVEKVVNSMFSAPFFYEFTDEGIDKAAPIQKILDLNHISAEELVAFGDGENDRSMIRLAGLGIAMENARHDVKGDAHKTTASNNEDGIALILEEHL